MGKPDWYTIAREALVSISGTPGLSQTKLDALWLMHRSHLPLLANLGNTDAAKILWPVPTDYRWSERDRRTSELGFKLRATQQTAIDFITARRGTLLGDEMRLGKTTSCVMAHDPSLGPLVVICPAMVRPVWLAWIAKIFPGEPVGVLAGRTFKPEIVDHKIVVGHYDILSSWQSDRRIGTLVFDEAHVLANTDSWRSRAAIYLANKAERVICATGTPIWNMPMNLWNVLSILAPGAFGGFHEFGRRYGAAVPTRYGTKYTGVSNGDELSERLTEVMIRRLWVDVASDLPEISRNVIQVDLDVEQRMALDLASDRILAEGNKSTIGNLAAYRRTTSLLKLAATVEQAKTMISRGEPVVVWTWHVDLAEKIAEAIGDRAFLVTGDLPAKSRDDALVAWKQTPASVLVCTMAVAQVGIDLSHAHLAIFAEIDYTPAILAQAEMRIYAPSRSMNITYVVVDHMVDQRIVLALTRKLAASTPLGLAAANDTISILGVKLGGEPADADMDRLLADLLAG